LNLFETLKKKFLEREFSKMNQQQREAIFHVFGRLLIIAGAGSGKTTVLVNRISNMICYGNAYNEKFDISEETFQILFDQFEKDRNLIDLKKYINFNSIDPENILAITFTNKAASEIKNRLSERIGSNSEKIWASTFHSMCARILRRHADKIGYSSEFTIYDSDDSKKLVKECQKILNIDEKNISIKSCISAISSAKDDLLCAFDFKVKTINDFRRSKISNVYELYEHKIKNSDAMDFDDLIFNTIKLFQKCPDVLDSYRKIFKFIMIDEYQDTSHAQHQLIKMLAGKNGNLCIVGDDDQSIYKFRGASVENILEFEKSFSDVKVIRLEQNYRSSKNILKAANFLIKNNVKRKGKNLWTNLEEGKKIRFHISYSEHDEASKIASEIQKRIDNGRKFSDFAVLYRTSSQSGVIEKILAKSSIPYKIVGGMRFFERSEVKDLLAYLSVINNPHDEIRLKRIINQPKRSIGGRTISLMGEIARDEGKSFFEVVKYASQYSELNRAAIKVSAFYSLIEFFINENKRGISLSKLYRVILEKTCFIDFLKSENDEADSRIANIEELASFISRFEEEKGENSTLSEFLEEIALISGTVNFENEDSGFVTLMTVHASKGLEFPVVFLPGFEEGIFPGQQSLYELDEIEEERRLAYVAITRAKEEFFMLSSTSRMIFGSTSHNKQSRFIDEIPKEIIEITRSREWKKMPSCQRMPFSTQDMKVKSVVSARNFGIKYNNNLSFTNEFALGENVHHITFGRGKIVSVVTVGNDQLIEVNFEKIGTKKMMSNVANLRKLVLP